MLKLFSVLTAVTIFLSFLVVNVSAVSPTGSVGIDVKAPASGVNPNTPVGTILSNALTIIFVLAALAVLFMLIIGAFQWITSGGDKEKYGAARGRITQALVGLFILALAFLITRVVGQVVNIDILNIKSIPTLDRQCGTNEVYNPETGTCTRSPSR